MCPSSTHRGPESKLPWSACFFTLHNKREWFLKHTVTSSEKCILYDKGWMQIKCPEKVQNQTYTPRKWYAEVPLLYTTDDLNYPSLIPLWSKYKPVWLYTGCFRQYIYCCYPSIVSQTWSDYHSNNQHWSVDMVTWCFMIQLGPMSHRKQCSNLIRLWFTHELSRLCRNGLAFLSAAASFSGRVGLLQFFRQLFSAQGVY